MKKFIITVALLVVGSAFAAPAPILTNPETEKLVQQRMIKYDAACQRTTGPADLYSCHHKRWEGLSEDVQSYAFQVQRIKARLNPQWYTEFERRYVSAAAYWRNCTIRFGQYNPMAAPEITACYLREYAFLEVSLKKHNDGSWTPTAGKASEDVKRKKADAYFRSIKETNSEEYEGD